jgi:hypothetical protein
MTESAKLTASAINGDNLLGSSVEISGNTVVAGAPAFGSSGIRGAGYIFRQTQA